MTTTAWSLRESAIIAPEEWKVARVGDLVDLINGYPFPSEEFSSTEGFPLVRIRDLLNEKFETFVTGYVPERVKVRDGDVVIGMDGDFNLSVWDRGPAALNQRLCLLRPKSDVDIRFVAYALPPALRIINDLTFSTTVKHLSSRQVLSERILLPSLGEQRRIANFLDIEVARINSTVSARRKQAALLNERWQSSLSLLIASLGSKFGFVALRRLASKVEQGWSPQCEDRLAEEGQWGVLKAGCVNGGFFDWRQHKALPSGVNPRLEYQIRPGDLLVSRASGSADLIGSAAVVPEISCRLLLCDKVYRISLDEAQVHAEFASYVLASAQVRNFFKSRISGGEGLANNLPVSVVKDVPIPKAPVRIQSSVLTEMGVVREQQKNVSKALNTQIDLLEERKRALITAAVTGQIDVTTARGADLS